MIVGYILYFVGVCKEKYLKSGNSLKNMKRNVVYIRTFPRVKDQKVLKWHLYSIKDVVQNSECLAIVYKFLSVDSVAVPHNQWLPSDTCLLSQQM